MTASYIKQRYGFALIIVLSIVLLLLLVGGAFQALASNDLSRVGASTDAIRAYYLAEAGIAKKFVELRSGNTSSITNESFSLAAGVSGTFSATASETVGGSLPTYRVDATGVFRRASRRITLDVKQISFARFSYFSNNEAQMFWWWRRPIWFVTGDHLRGPLHTNDQLNISGDPIFDGPVSSTNLAINYYHGGPPDDNPTFNDSLTLGAPLVSFPLSSGIVNDIRTASRQTGGLYFTGATTITLSPDGTMFVTNQALSWTNHQVDNPSNSALFVENGSVYVSGTLSGQLTVGTNNSIVITNNILYNTDPEGGTSTDMLGLVSANNVIVSTNAPFDLTIDAYIVALNTSFTVEDYWDDLKGTLNIYGGITQYQRGAIGTFNAETNERVSGYTKDYFYDDRLQDQAPPYFPVARDSNNRVLYRKLLWREY